MLPVIKENQKIFIEITNLIHGGLGWELGSCMWSPVYNEVNSKSWSLLEQIRTGDIVLHLVKIKDIYHFYGVSIVSSNLIECNDEPPLADIWANKGLYQRINLNNFNMLDNPIPVTEIFSSYKNELLNILASTESNFYVNYGGNGDLRVGQRYAATCSEPLYEIFNDISMKNNFNPVFNNEQSNIPTPNEPQNPDYNSPGRVSTSVTRAVRDTRISKEIKKKYNWKCQICGAKILLPSTKYYAEAHHLKPLGGTHEGPDHFHNLIVLCPSHHSEFDYGCIAINPKTKLIEHINHSNIYHNRPLSYQRNDLGSKFILYHYEKRFNKI